MANRLRDVDLRETQASAPKLEPRLGLAWNILSNKTKNGVWTIRTNQELMDVYREADIVSEITKAI